MSSSASLSRRRPHASQRIQMALGDHPKHHARPVARTDAVRSMIEREGARAAGGQVLGYGTYLTAHSAGRLCSIHFPSDRDRCPARGKRGKVVGFSSGSRLRMIRKIHTIERAASMPHFVTLTFPDLFPTFEDAKRKLTVLFKRWKRRWPKTAAIWRLETVARKSGSMAGQIAPHFHLLVWGKFDAKQARDDWFEVCGSDEYAHFRHGTDVGKLMDDWKQAAAYCAKYCAKESDVASEAGRIWGVHNRAALPVDREPVVMRLTLPEAFACRRLVRRAIKAKTGKVARLAQSLYTGDPESFLRFICARRGVEMRAHG